ncbi:MAG TPA: efflux RND transporter periplasmic adaptor subunit [Candidatus Eisenbacteria bacterium]|nr:efflux RND transporter periplasmic adaptor subunit [Candidatus Eisenbacteria bacterium]
MTRLLVGLALLAALGGAGCGSRSEAEGTAGATKPEPVTITTAPVATRMVERTISVVGTLTANMQAEVAAEVEGQVTGIEADLGDRVVKDQVLARVRSDVLEARLGEAEASYEKALADEARGRPLKDDKIISAQEYEQVRTALAVAKARREQLRIEVERATIRAPFDGSIAARLVDAGNYVRPGTTVFRLVQDDPLKFRGEIPERDVPAVEAEQQVRVSVDAYPGEAFQGRVSRVGSASNPQARSLAFEALVPNTDHRVRPGFFGRAEIIVRRDERAVAVPRSAVTSFAGVTKIFVVEDGVAHEREVTLGVDLGDGWVEITQGVTKGIQVATSGLSKLADGTVVQVRADAPPGA